MNRFYFFLLFFLIFFPRLMLFGFSPNDTQPGQELRGQNDSVEKQILFNGRAWRNLYYNVQGDQFLFENKFFPGTVTIGNRQFTGIILKYDIFNDEIITVNNMGIIIQLNKEMIDRFTLSSGDITYYFYQIDTAQYAPFSGYVNVLFEDDVSLLIRYRKEILQHTGDAVFYRFNQLHRIYLSKEGILYPVGNKKDLLDFMTDRLHLVRSYIKNNRIRISKKDPRSFVPVVEYYNNLLHQK